MLYSKNCENLYYKNQLNKVNLVEAHTKTFDFLKKSQKINTKNAKSQFENAITQFTGDSLAWTGREIRSKKTPGFHPNLHLKKNTQFQLQYWDWGGQYTPVPPKSSGVESKFTDPLKE